MSIKDELEMIRQQHDGILQPTAALQWAADNPQSDLHKSIEWDDTKAAHEHRIWQIRRLIAIHVVTPEAQRQLISLTIDRMQPGGGYRHIDDVMRDRTMRQIALADALTELGRIRAKYEGLTELARVWEALDAVSSSHRRSRRRGSGEARLTAG